MSAYTETTGFSVEKILSYAVKMGNGAILKRLGFFLERSGAANETVLADLRSRLSAGNARLDPALPSGRLITRWRLWIPENWKEFRHD